MHPRDHSIGSSGIEREDLVGHDANTTLAREITRPTKRLTMLFAALRFDEIVAVDQANVTAGAALQFEGDHERVLKKQAPHALAAGCSVHVLKGLVQIPTKTPCATRGEAIDQLRDPLAW